MTIFTRRHFRAIIYYNFSRRLGNEEMLEMFGKDCPSVRTVERWYLRGSFVLEDRSHTRRPSDVATPESVDAVWKAITLNRRIMYRQLEELLNIPKINFTTDCFGAVIREKAVHIMGTHALPDEQPENRVKWCKKC